MGELLFRIVERYKPLSIVAVGARHPSLAAYAAAPSAAIKLYSIESVKSGTKELKKGAYPSPTLFLLDDNATKEEWTAFYKEAKELMGESSVVVVTDIQDDGGKKALWNTIYLDQTAGAMFDLYDMGIIFLQNGLHKKRYIVSF